MAGPWEKYQQAPQTPQAPQGPWNKYAAPTTGPAAASPSWGEIGSDVATQGVVGLEHFGASTLGLPGDIGRFGQSQEAKIAELNKQHPLGETAGNILEAPSRAMSWGLSKLPSTEDIQAGIQKLAGPLPEARTPAGKVAKYVGEFLPVFMGRGRPKLPSVKAAPDLKEIKSAKTAAYKAAEESGFLLPADDYAKLVDEIGTDAVSQGARDYSTPAMAGFLKDMNAEIGSPKSYQDLHAFRKLAAKLGRARDANGNMTHDAMLANQAAAKIDNVLSGVEEHVLANQINSTFQKSLRIQHALQKAENAAGPNYSQAGLATAIQQKFRAIADKAEMDNWRGYTTDEKDAILSIVRPGIGQRLLRGIGAAAPGGGGMGNMFNVALTATKPMVGLPVAAATVLARKRAAKVITDRAAIADALFRSGGYRANVAKQAPHNIRGQIARALLGAKAAYDTSR